MPSKINIPPYLKKGSTIAITCPAGYMSYQSAETAISVLQQLGYQVIVGKTLGNDNGTYFSASDEERLSELQAMLDAKNVDAILCARGGYGISRIIDHIDWKWFKKNPKWLIGFSDVTVLHSCLYQQVKTASIHGPMCAAFNDNKYKDVYVQSLLQVMKGKRINYSTAAHALNTKGKATGILVGGNVSLLAHQTGSATQLQTKGNILVLEEIGEQVYNVDRMMLTLKRSGQLANLAALIIGTFSDGNNTTRPFGKTEYELIKTHVAEYGYPVCFGFPIGHTSENYAVKLGVTYTLSVGKTVSLKEV
jgi:muramoyltetrapeptide carboxypeptidase